MSWTRGGGASTRPGRQPPPWAADQVVPTQQRGSGGIQSRVQSVLQIDVEVDEPETSENLTQSFIYHYIFRRRTRLFILCNHIMYNMIIIIYI